MLMKKKDEEERDESNRGIRVADIGMFLA